MNVEVKYFGLVAEKLGKTDESLLLEESDIKNLKQFFETKYPDLTMVNYQIAVNKTLANHIETNATRVEVALLPPFAGG